MGKYENYSKDELIHRIEDLEAELKKGLRSAHGGESMDEYIQHERKINFLNILMDTILSNVFVEIAVKDIFNGFQYIYFNKAAEEFTGVSAEDVLGKTDFELFPDARRAHEIRTEDYSTIKNGRTEKFMTEYEKPNGEIRIVNTVRLLITNPDPGASPLLLVLLWDMTEQRQNELDLVKAQEAEKMKNAFIANMSHEIRTPLNAIVGFSRLITETETESEQQEYLTIINRNCDLLLQLINDILDFSKIESGILSYNLTHVELKEICQDVYVTELLKMTPDVALLYNADSLPPLCLWTDPQRIEQVLYNLLSNAIKCTTQGSVSLAYAVEDDFVRISVTDTGVGIPDEKLNCVFERFVKLNDFRQGTGLGLSICQMIVEKLGGKIGVRSKVGVGSTFWFTLPLEKVENLVEEKELVAITTDTIAEALPGQYTLLIAEDVLENYLMLQTVLKKQYRLLYAVNGRQAVDMFKSYAPDLVLMDINMPVMDGFEAIREIRSVSENVPVIALTAFVFSEEKEKDKKYRFTDYLVKPVDLFLMRHKIKFYLNNRE